MWCVQGSETIFAPIFSVTSYILWCIRWISVENRAPAPFYGGFQGGLTLIYELYMQTSNLYIFVNFLATMTSKAHYNSLEIRFYISLG